MVNIRILKKGKQSHNKMFQESSLLVLVEYKQIPFLSKKVKTKVTSEEIKKCLLLHF